MQAKYLIGMLMLATSVCNLNARAVDNKHLYCIILAGGNGERLWPLSRQQLPKQLLVLGGATLLDQAIERVMPLVPQENILVSTTKQHEKRIREYVGKRIGDVIAEPASRNTGPAILLCCLEIMARDPQAVIAFVPADPFIPHKDTDKFVGFLDHALTYAQTHETITLMGVKPTYAATGYGYIECDTSTELPYRVKKFKEKPSAAVAQEYLQSPAMLWNISIFCAQVSVFIQEFKLHAPAMYHATVAYTQGGGSFDTVPADSIDYAIMEKSSRINVLPADFAWCDVGNVEVFLSIKNLYEHSLNDPVAVDAHNNLVDVPGKRVALVGVDNLCVVETGDVLLITHRDKAEQVKAIVKQLKQENNSEYL